MMNVIQIQEALKGMPLEQLVREMQMPSGQAPQFLVLGEIARRKQMEQEFSQRQGQPQTTVAEDAVTAAGVPQQGIASAARAMAPKTDMAMNTAPTQQAPVQGMANGGYVQKMQAGGIADRERAARLLAGQITPRVGTLTTDPSILRLANAFGITVAEAIRMVEDNPQLLAATETPSAMITAPGVSARPTMPVDSRILPAGYDDVFSRIGRYDEPAMPESPMRPVGGSLSAVPPVPTPARPVFDARDGFDYDPASMTAEEILAAASGPRAPLPTSPEVNRAVAAREARQSRIGADTSSAAAMRNRLDEYAYPPIPPAVPAGMEMELARAALGEEALSGRLGMDTAEAATLRNRGDILARSGLRIPGARTPYSMPMGGLEALMASRQPPAEVPPSLAEIESGVPPEYTAPPAEEVAVEPGVVTAPPEAPPMPRDDRAPAGTYTGTGVSRPVAAPSIAAAMSPLETEIGNILQQREQRAQQDKWLALAQAGMALMSSRQPTFAGALGEAGLVGVEGFRKARDQYEEDRLSLMTAQEKLRAARAAAGARGAATVKAETRAPALKPSDIATYYGKRAEIIKNMGEAIDEETKELYRRELIALERAFAAATSAPFDATVGEEG